MNEEKNMNEAENTADDSIYTKKSSKRLTAISALVVVAVIILNVIISVLGDSRLWYIDLTQTRYQSQKYTMYTLSDECSDMIGEEAIPMIDSINAEKKASGEDPIKVNIVFCADKDVIEADGMMRYVSYTARALAKEYPDAIDVQYINMAKNPSAVQKYKTTSAATIYNSDVIVEFGSEYLIQGINSFYYIESTETTPWAYNGEKKLAAMILAVTRAEAPICCITSNHGETLFDENGEIKDEYSTFIKLIRGAGYDPQIINLETDEIPENCRMMVTFNPTEDFKAFGNLGENNVSEIEKLDKYLDGANAFFYVCNEDTPVLTNLEEYLEEWGVTVTRLADKAGNYNNYAIEDQTNCTDSGTGRIVVGNYATESLGATLTKDMRARSYPPKVVFGNSTAISPASNYLKTYVAADEEAGTAAFSYYSYYKNGINRSMFDVFTTYSTASARVGSEIYEIATQYNLFKLMTVTQETRQVQDGNFSAVNQASYVVALASTDFLKNDVLDSTAYGNTDVMLSALRNMGSVALPADIELKAFYIYEMEDNAAYLQANPTVWFRCLTLIPVIAIFGIGIVINVRRRYK
ncbi:MAG: Gldg family protein [Clostridia bacterium]|nr:Gldg family protein [Clostridia bacterium]